MPQTKTTEEFLEISNDLTEDLVKTVNAVVNRFAQKYGTERTMECLGSSLAISTGNIVSTLCYGLSDQNQRSPFITNFIKLLRESADAHKKRHTEKAH